jgi:hypothetical protein
MVNGKEGDHPLTDIVNYGIEVFSADIDAKVRERAHSVTVDGLTPKASATCSRV